MSNFLCYTAASNDPYRSFPKKLIHVYVREFLKYCINCHFLLMDSQSRREVCERLQISNEMLNELVKYCFDWGYVSFNDGDFPYYCYVQCWALKYYKISEEEAYEHA